MMLMRTCLALSLLAACGACTTRPAADAVLTAPAALTINGVPPVPAELARKVGAYNEFKGAGLLGWSPDGRELLVSFLRGARTQLHTVSGPGQTLALLTQAEEPTRSGEFLPADGRYVVFERDAGGSEASRVYRLDRSNGTETALTPSGQRCDMGPFDPSGRQMLVSCVLTDRGAGGNAERAGGVFTEFLLIDVPAATTRLVARLQGPGWFPSDVSPDGRCVLTTRFKSVSDAEVWEVDVADGQSRRVLPRAGDPAAFHSPAFYAADSERIFVATDRSGEFVTPYRYSPKSQLWEPLAGTVQGDARGGAASRDRSRMVGIYNVAGRGVLRVYDAATLRLIAAPDLPGQNVTSAQLNADGTRLAYSATSARAPSEVSVIELALSATVPAAADAPLTAAGALWVAADTAGIDTARFQPIEVIRWTSFDGREISGLIQRPPKSFTGKRPVLIDIHGGPEAQAQVSFNGRYNYVVNELGVALIEPNVRGSTGFGKTFHQLDNGRLREDSVKDIGALLDWIALQPDLDASRVMVQGGSYGGYMSNAVAVHYSNRIRGALPTVGISNFVSFLERTESYRRDLRRAEYGDERDPAMRKWMEDTAPLNNANKIKVPMFVIHGRNDPRVPVQEAEQIAATIAKNGVPVWTMIAENEGHGFAKKENADYLFLARLMFLQKYLLDGKP